MAWNKPKKVWQWLLLLSPGAVSLACSAITYFIATGRDITPALLGFLAVFPLCPVIAYFLVRRTGSVANMMGYGLLFTFLLLVVNVSIAIGGCAVMPGHMDFR
jgi:hypothetical protein